MPRNMFQLQLRADSKAHRLATRRLGGKATRRFTRRRICQHGGRGPYETVPKVMPQCLHMLQEERKWSNRRNGVDLHQCNAVAKWLLHVASPQERGHYFNILITNSPSCGQSKALNRVVSKYKLFERKLRIMITKAIAMSNRRSPESSSPLALKIVIDKNGTLHGVVRT